MFREEGQQWFFSFLFLGRAGANWANEAAVKGPVGEHNFKVKRSMPRGLMMCSLML